MIVRHFVCHSLVHENYHKRLVFCSGRLSVQHPFYLTCTMISEARTPLTQPPCYLLCSMIKKPGTQLIIHCYLTWTLTTEIGNLLTTACYLTCSMIRIRHSTHHTSLPEVYHNIRGRLCSPLHAT